MRPGRSVALVVTLVLLLGSTAAAAPPHGSEQPRWLRRIAPTTSPKLAPEAAGAAPSAMQGPLAGIRPLDDGVDSAGRRDVVVEGTNEVELADLVVAHRGEVLTSAPGAVHAAVPVDQLDDLAAEPAVSLVRAPRALHADTTSEGVATTGAATWQGGGADGAGVKVAIVDLGFDGWVSKLGTELPVAVVTQNFCGPGITGFDGRGPSGTGLPTSHGVATAEIVHDMAPGATLYLVCIYDGSDFAAAEAFLEAEGVSIVNASIGSAIDGRGDGGSGYASAAVKAGREAGQLWTVAAGNLGGRHFDALLSDHDGDGAMEMFSGPQDPNGPDSDELYSYYIAANDTSVIQLKWDAWPVTNFNFDVYVFIDQIDDAHLLDCSYGGCIQQGNPWTAPVEQVAFKSDGLGHYVYVAIGNMNGALDVRADLYLLGQEYAFKALDPLGSLSDPATSPFVMAAGAACFSGSAIEPFSSQGPTIDGRVKPDITGPDGTSSSVYGAATDCIHPTGFTGTSAAAPHVAGAAALFKQANPALDSSQIQALLEARVQDAGAPGKDNVFGAGLLRLGATGPPQPPTPRYFTPVDPVRVMDTRPGLAPATNGDHPIGAGGFIAQRFAGQTFGATSVPADATAVVLNVTAVNATTGGWFTIWPNAAPFPNASSLNFGPGQIVANSVTATIGQSGYVDFFNSAGTTDIVVDLVGWYGPTGSSGFQTTLHAGRVLDTRSNGGPLAAGTSRAVAIRDTNIGNTIVPSNATAVLANITAVSPTASGYLQAYPTGGAAVGSTSSLNFTPGANVPNLTFTKIGTDGSISVYNSAGATQVIVDVVAFFVPGSGDGYVPLPNPVRDLDTRTGNGPRLGMLTPQSSQILDAGGNYGVPYAASAVLYNTTVTGPLAAGYLVVFASDDTSSASNLNYVAGQTVANAVVSRLSSAGGAFGPNGRTTFFTQQPTHVVNDLQGYFVSLTGEPPPPPPPPLSFPEHGVAPPGDPLGWVPPDGIDIPGTFVYMTGSVGDYIVGPHSYRYTKADSILQVTTSGSHISVSVDADTWWYADFDAATGDHVVAGYTAIAHRYPFYSPGLSVFGDGRGCNESAGRMIVDEISYDGQGVVSTLTLRFEQDCENFGPPLFGKLHYVATDPTMPPGPSDPSSFTWHPGPGTVPASGNYLYLQGASGDYISAGVDHLFTTGLTVTSNGLHISGSVTSPYWWASFTGPYNMTRLEPGLYADLMRDPFHNPAKGGIEISGDGRGCNTILGSFVVDAISFDGGGALQSVDLRFVQRCEKTGPPMYGALHWSAA